jgi:CTP:molybdopterin cytidylyltransferase MocA
MLEGDIGARRLFELEGERIETLPWTDDSILRDVDTIAALDAIRQQSQRAVHHL